MLSYAAAYTLTGEITTLDVQATVHTTTLAHQPPQLQAFIDSPGASKTF